MNHLKISQVHHCLNWLTEKFHVDFAINLNMALEKQHEYSR